MLIYSCTDGSRVEFVRLHSGHLLSEAKFRLCIECVFEPAGQTSPTRQTLLCFFADHGAVRRFNPICTGA